MWKNNINIIKKRDINYSVQEYCLWFSFFFNLEIKNINIFKPIIEKENGDLLPISKNICNFFYNGELENFVNFIYHINELSSLDFLTMNQNNLNTSEFLFNQNINVFFNTFSLDLELLLSSNNNNAHLIYLFMFFLPVYKDKELLIHPKKNIPLISCHKITQNNFDMLLFLMKSFDRFDYYINSESNLNILLIEDFCQYSNQFFFNKKKDDWYDILPLEKIKKLFNEKCYLNKFSTEKNKKLYYTIPTLNDFIFFYQKELEVELLEKKLTIKNGQSTQNKIIKI